MLKQTALIEEHRKHGAKLIDFGGWELPVQYTNLSAEHESVRTAAGLFDVSHMGEIQIEGPSALEFVNWVTTNDASKLNVGDAQYSAFLNEQGGIIDDLVVYRTQPQVFFLVVNASNTEKDFIHLKNALEKFPASQKPKLTNASSSYSQLALQGPLADEILSKLTQVDLKQIKTYSCKPGLVANVSCLIARTGYTGESGFELYCPWSDGPKLWQALIEIGTPLGLKPCGLGARDTLRTEMKYALYGNELNEQTLPLEVGLGWITKLNKTDFIGKKTVEALKEKGVSRTLVGIEGLGRAIPRSGYAVFNEDQSQQIGVVTSGTLSPSLKKPIGIVLIDRPYDSPETLVKVKIREQFELMKVVPTPFYKR